jgi:DNA repair protein RecN (Recombination protein N)
VAGADGELDLLVERLRAVRLEAEDLGVELRRYAGGLEAEPGRLEEVEARLEQYERLRRKHGGTIESVLAHADHCRAELERLERADEDATRIEAELSRALAEERELADGLAAARGEAGPRLAERVREELDQLAMDGAEFAVELQPREELGAAGAERVEFLVAPNPGVPPMPRS